MNWSGSLSWRELIAESYVADSLLEDAEIALTSFDRDYRPSNPDWEHRYIRTLFLTGFNEESGKARGCASDYRGQTASSIFRNFRVRHWAQLK